MALEALESTGENDGYAGVTQFYDGELVSAAEEALREALAEQPQEPLNLKCKSTQKQRCGASSLQKRRSLWLGVCAEEAGR